MMNLLEYISTKTNLASAGTRAASGRRRPAQNQAFITYLRVPSPRPGTNLNPGLIEDAFTSAALKGGVGDGGPVCRTRSGLGGGCSRRSLLPSRSSDSSESNLNAAGRPRRGGPQAVVSESHSSGEPERSTNLATSQLASESSIQFQVCDRLSSKFTGKFKFVIAASRSESRSLRSRIFGTSVSSSLSPLVPSPFVLASSAHWPSVESARDGAGRGDAAGVCRAAPVAALLCPPAELDNVSRASRHCPWRLTGRQSRQSLVCSAAAMVRRDRPSATDLARSQSRQSLVPRFKSCWAQDVGSAGCQNPRRLTGL